MWESCFSSIQLNILTWGFCFGDFLSFIFQNLNDNASTFIYPGHGKKVNWKVLFFRLVLIWTSSKYVVWKVLIDDKLWAGLKRDTVVNSIHVTNAFTAWSNLAHKALEQRWGRRKGMVSYMRESRHLSAGHSDGNGSVYRMHYNQKSTFICTSPQCTQGT